MDPEQDEIETPQRQTPQPDFDVNDPEQLIRAFQSRYPFALDDFQMEAIRYLAYGESAMVAAPTGTGKTVVAEFGVFRAVARGWRVMYTTPIKALSNQKFRDFREQYGDAVGLLTGDIIENREGAVLVMTTEVLRNMLLQTPSELWGVGCIVFDEIHYLADEERGTTWEEAIIMCPKDIQLACLSATVSNAPEIAEWITRTHAPVHLVTHYNRAVPLSYYYYLDGELNLVINDAGKQVANFANIGGEMRRHVRGNQFGTGREEDGGSARERPEPTPREIVSALEAREMLPAIYFLFSRRDCEAAAEVCAMMRLRAVQDTETRQRIEDILAKYMERLTAEDRELEQVKTIVYLVRRGFGFHHAGLLPILKQLVEEVFSNTLMRVVFATDTLALGINMPARTVIIGRMNKWDGVQRRPLIPNEFQQMAGRAGRRGIDPQGFVVLPYSPWVTFNEALAIATGPLRPVESAFTIRYNTVLNLWNPPDGDRVLEVMRHSLLQFQQSRRLFDVEAAVAEWDRELAEIPTGCLIGLPEGESLIEGFEELGRVLETARDRERKLVRNRARISDSRSDLPWRRPERELIRRLLRAFEPGALVHLEKLGWGVYLGNPTGSVGLFWAGDRVVSLSQYSQVDFIPPEQPSIELPAELLDIASGATPFINSDEIKVSYESREWLQEKLVAVDLPDLDTWIAEHQRTQGADIDGQLSMLDTQIAEAHEYTTRIAAEEREHPCQTCPVRKQHRTYRRRRAKAEGGREESLKFLEQRRTYEENRLSTLLGGMVSVLRRFYYLDKDGNLTAKAARLIDIFDTNALMISELIESGYLDGLAAHDLAEIFSWFAYDRDVEFRNRHLLPSHLVRLRERLDELQREVFQTERRFDLMISTGYNPYFYGAARAWCRGATMAELLGKVELSEGDLVATFNKTIDLMRQVREMLARGSGAGHSSRNKRRAVAEASDATLAIDEALILRESLQEAEAQMRRGVVAMVYNLGFVAQQQPGLDGARQDLSGSAAEIMPDRSPFVSTGFEDVDRMLGLLSDPNAVSPPPQREEGLERVNRSRREDMRPQRTNNRFTPPAWPAGQGQPSSSQPPASGQPRPHSPAPRQRPPNRKRPHRGK